MLAFFATALLLSTAVSATETSTPVLDMDGDELQAGVRYYMISAIRGAGGGGLTLRPKFGTICPLYVAQEPSDLMEGLPLVLHPANTNDKIIYTSTDFNVEVIKNTYFCRVSPVWKLDLDTQSVEGSRIGIGGVLGNPGEETMSNWFKIEQIGFRGIYKISYCPSVVKGSTVPCGDVGLAEGRFLGLTDNRPFYLVFKKADTITKTSDTEIYGEIRKVI